MLETSLTLRTDHSTTTSIKTHPLLNPVSAPITLIAMFRFVLELSCGTVKSLKLTLYEEVRSNNKTTQRLCEH